MKSGHEGIKEILPEYLRDALSKEIKDTIKAHLRSCEECRGELSLMAELLKVDVPDPGDLFWKTLPKKMRSIAEEERVKRFSIRSLLFRPLPATVTIMVLLLLIFIFAEKNDIPELDPTFVAPLTASVLDYDDVTEKDIPVVTEQPVAYEIYAEDLMEYSYHREFASLSSREMESLYEALGKQQNKGG